MDETTPTTRRVAARVRYALLSATALCVLSAAATARAAGAGPGPFENGGFFRDGALVLTIRVEQRGAVGFDARAALLASSDGVTWIPFDETPDVSANGARLSQRGTIAGVAVDAYFPQSVQRRLLVRSGGATTELDVARLNDVLLVLRTNRRPSEPVKTTSFATAARGFDARASGSVRIEVPRPSAAASGYDVVVATTQLASEEPLTDRTVVVVALPAGGGEPHPATLFNIATNEVLFHHLALPEGDYTIRVEETIAFGNPAVSTTRITLVHEHALDIHVSATERLFAVTLPAPSLPPLVDATLTVSGIGVFQPSFARRVDLEVELNAPALRVRATAARDVGDSGPVTIPFRLPAATYGVGVSARLDADDPNGVSSIFTAPVGSVDFPGDATTVAIPPLVRLSGTLRDPSLTLASDPDPFTNATPTHAVTVVTTGSSSPATSVALLRGFARGYTVYVPAGAVLRVSGSVTLAVAKPAGRPRSTSNATALLSIVVAPPVEPCVDACIADVAVPDLGRVVTIKGTVVDAKGTPQPQTFVAVSRTLGDVGAPSELVAYVLTSAKGTFTLHVPAGDDYRVTIYRF